MTNPRLEKFKTNILLLFSTTVYDPIKCVWRNLDLKKLEFSSDFFSFVEVIKFYCIIFLALVSGQRLIRFKQAFAF